jgi:RNA polymerase sigma factor (sigma-70 family)
LDDSATRPLTDEQRGLATRYLPLARSLARRVERSWAAEREELEAVAYLALVEAAGAFDPRWQVSFATYARLRIRGALSDFRRRERRRPTGGRRVGLRGPDPGSHAEEHGRVFGVNPDWPIGTEIEALEMIESWLKRLPGALAATCELIYVHGLSQGEAARYLGCSKSRVSRLHRDALFHLLGQWNQAVAETTYR